MTSGRWSISASTSSTTAHPSRCPVTFVGMKRVYLTYQQMQQQAIACCTLGMQAVSNTAACSPSQSTTTRLHQEDMHMHGALTPGPLSCSPMCGT